MSLGSSSSLLLIRRQIFNFCNQLLRKKQSIIKEQLRYLNLHENIAYNLLKQAGIPTPPFGVARSPDEAAKIAAELKSNDLVVKAQVLTGGRGKGRFQNTTIGGVIMCESVEQVKQVAEKMIGNLLITKQTGVAGRICNSVMVTKRMFSRKEYYLSIMLERTFDGAVVIASSRGGVNIEEVAATDPEAVIYIPINMNKGITNDLIECIIHKLDFKGQSKDVVTNIVCNLYELFVETDALLIEINPLAEDICGQYYALDCKCNFDDSSQFRQKKLFALEDQSQKDINEIRAQKFHLNYIQLDGTIGCMVNGAGLAMATMDLISYHGGSPANFLDVGGSASKEAITEAFRIITSDPKVLAIFVNIFGGIVKCDIIAEGIITAIKELQTKVPIIIRLEGTNVEKAKKLIFDSKLKLIFMDDLSEAGLAVTKFATIMNLARSLNIEILACKSNLKQTIRNLNVHEHISYSLLNEAGVPTPKFGVAKTADEAAKLAADLKTKDIVLKAQVLAGGRGKGHFKDSSISGVKMCETPEEAKALASQMLGKLLITKQTGEAGRICNAVMVTQRMFPRKEYYLAVMMERAFGGPVIIASSQGGVNIEEVAATNPSAIMYEPVDVNKGITKEQAERIVKKTWS
ncbi:hypothetical protein M0802_001596 [Mischocyttarus mexicanus]|nr:hypothetical protein M0802_001596 [Mischocyttarus mexicanus]